MLGGPIMKAPLRYDFASFSTEAQAVCPEYLQILYTAMLMV